MYRMIKENDCFNTPIREYMCDQTSDLDKIENAPTFSTAYCIEDKKVYILNSSGKWEEM